MNWSKISMMGSISPVLGVMEWSKQDKQRRTKNDIEYKLNCMKDGQTIYFGRLNVVRRNRTFVVNNRYGPLDIHRAVDYIMDMM